MPTQALLFDLDDTLILEEPVAHKALQEAGKLAEAGAQISSLELTQAVLKRARELWCGTPVIGYCREVGISSWEGLWAEFTGGDESLVWLREWSPTYRYEAWSRALLDLGVEDQDLARNIADEFIEI